MRSVSRTLSRARSAPSGPEFHNCRSGAAANATVRAARWLHAHTFCADSNPTTACRKPWIAAHTSGKDGVAVPRMFSMSMRTRCRPRRSFSFVFVIHNTIGSHKLAVKVHTYTDFVISHAGQPIDGFHGQVRPTRSAWTSTHLTLPRRSERAPRIYGEQRARPPACLARLQSALHSPLARWATAVELRSVELPGIARRAR